MSAGPVPDYCFVCGYRGDGEWIWLGERRDGATLWQIWNCSDCFGDELHLAMVDWGNGGCG